MTANVKTTAFQAEQGSARSRHPDSGNNRHSQNQPVRVAGLCATCIHAPDCTLNTYPREPVLYCEEFDSRLDVVGDSSTGSEKSSANKKLEADTVEQTDRHFGLCINCVHRDICKLPRAEGGVWYCEEYE